MKCFRNHVSVIFLPIRWIFRFRHQNKELRFDTFIFGPVVMRLFHYLNLPDHALQVLHDPVSICYRFVHVCRMA